VRAAARVHEKIAHGGGFEAQLPGYRHLHLFGRTLCLLKYGQRALRNSIDNWWCRKELLVQAEAGRGRRKTGR
jgi:hypothetical protein